MIYQVMPIATEPMLDFVFMYTDLNDFKTIRHINPRRIFFGTTEYNSEPAWILEGDDIDRKGQRYFLLDRVDVLMGLRKQT